MSRVFETPLYFHLGRYRFNKKFSKSDWVKRPINNSNIVKEVTNPPERKILFVVEAPSINNWNPGAGNLMFEIVETAREKYGSSNISTFFCGEKDSNWKEKLLEQVRIEKPTEIFLNIEIDPDNSWEWNWDKFIYSLRLEWNGVLDLFLYDSVYFLHQWRLDLITRRDSNVRVISIDINCRRHYRGPAINYGPAIIPMSRKTLELSQSNEDLEKIYRVSFVGALYDYRKSAIANLERKNIRVEVNPHRRTDEAGSYQTYLGALGRSIFTINFSRANKMNRKQLKCRMLESALYGAIAVSDERKWTGTLFRPNLDYVYVRTIGSAHKAISRLTSEEISTMRENALQRAREVNVSIV